MIDKKGQGEEMIEILIRTMNEDDILLISSAFKNQGWNKPESQYKYYLAQQAEGLRKVFIADYKGAFAGYVTVLYKSEDPYFSEHKIPEIVDLNVLIKFRKLGIGSMLMDAAEAHCFSNAPHVGLSVGLLSDYGNAQKLYIKRGYMPVGDGIKSGNRILKYFDQVQVDDDLVLSFIKPGRK